MADKTHLEIIKRGVDAWNQWRRDNPYIIANLSGVDLSGADLSGANLSHSDLSRAQLRRAHLIKVSFSLANLIRADLNTANLSEANLSGANLSEAEFIEANLWRTNLIKADLRKAHLREAHLGGAHLDGADLSGATITGVTFANNSLSTVKGLDKVKHEGPSTIGVDTLNHSQGNIPEVFLRGCGLSDWQIEAAKLNRLNLVNQELGDVLYRIHDLRAQRPIQINPLFISYAHADGDFVDQLEHHLVNDGIRFWRDVHHAMAGRLERQVDHAIRLNPTVLLILSKNSVRSDWVEHEARLARKLEKELGRDVICPIALDGSWKNCEWPERLREQIMEYNILDFSQWRDVTKYERVYRRLIDGLHLFYKKKDENNT